MHRQLLTENAVSYGPPNHYALLGVSPTASADAIKQAYRTQVFRHHPDRNQGNPSSAEMMVRINEAYQVLSDSDKRKAYDVRMGIGAVQPVPSAPQPSNHGSFWRPPGAIQPQVMDNTDDWGLPKQHPYRQTGGGFGVSKAVLSHSMYVKSPSAKDRQIMYAKGYQPCGYCRGIGVIPSEYNVTTIFCKPCSGSGYIPRIRG